MSIEAQIQISKSVLALSKGKEDADGVWRTVGGRRVFIAEGQSFDDALAADLGSKKTAPGKLSAKTKPEEIISQITGGRANQPSAEGANSKIKIFRGPDAKKQAARYASSVEAKTRAAGFKGKGGKFSSSWGSIRVRAESGAWGAKDNEVAVHVIASRAKQALSRA